MSRQSDAAAFEAAGSVAAFLDHYDGDPDDEVIETVGYDALTVGMLRALLAHYKPCGAAYGRRLIVHCGHPGGHDGAHKASLAGGSISWHGDDQAQGDRS